MKKAAKPWLIIAISLVLFGVIIFVVVMTMLKWDFNKLNTNKFITNTYELNEEFSSILINLDTADIVFYPSNDGTCKVVCAEFEKLKHSVDILDETLTINLVDERKWYEYIGINFGTAKISVYLPNREYGALVIKESTGDIKIPNDFRFESADISVSTGDVKFLASAVELIKIKASTGDIKAQNISATALDFSVTTGEITAKDIDCNGDIKIGVSTGDTTLTNSTCQNLSSSGNTGDITLKNVLVNDKLSVKRSTGDVRFNDSDAGEIFVLTDTGNVKGSLLTSKVFITQTDTGRVDVPKTVTGGKCEITTDTGDIKIEIKD